MMSGREPRFPLEAEKAGDGTDMSDVQKQWQDCDVEQVIDRIIEKQTSLFCEVEQRPATAQEKQKEQYQRRKRIVQYQFEIGCKVLRRNMKKKTKKGHKSEDPWLGPYTIAELSATSCLLVNKHNEKLKTGVNLSQLKLYHEPITTSEETKSMLFSVHVMFHDMFHILYSFSLFSSDTEIIDLTTEDTSPATEGTGPRLWV